MKDSADGDADADDVPRSGARGITSDDVPQDASWELAVQKPVDEGRQGSLTTTIVYAVADAEEISPVDVKRPPLYDVIDVAALEASFFGSEGISRSRNDGSATEFMYRGHRVVVRRDGWVCVYDLVEE